MNTAAKLTLAVTTWLLLIVGVYFVPDEVIPTEWKWALIGTLSLPFVLLIKAIVEGVFELAFRGFTKFLFLVFTLGKVRPERSTEFVRFPWYGVAKGADGKWVVDEDLAALVAIGVLVGMGIAAFLALR